MAKTNISQWDTTAGNNLDLNSISVAEGWLPSTVNNFEREEISQLAKFYDDFGGVNTVGGTANAITITTSTVFTALATGMRMRMVAGSSNSGATTLNLDAIGAKAVRKLSGGTDVALVAGDIMAGRPYDIVYSTAANGAAGGWIITPSLVVKRQVFTSNGTYTPTTGMLFCDVECFGAGGGGGGAATSGAGSQNSSGGGGAGGYSRLLTTAAAIGASQTVTIGALGAGGTAGNNNGSAGGDTSLGTLCIAKGASGGTGSAAASTTPGQGGAGGTTAGTGDIVGPGTKGASGGLGGTIVTLGSRGGGGGSAVYGAGGSGTQGGGGGNASGFGAGGGGAGSFNNSAAAAGGDGTAGLVIVTEYLA